MLNDFFSCILDCKIEYPSITSVPPLVVGTVRSAVTSVWKMLTRATHYSSPKDFLKD